MEKSKNLFLVLKRKWFEEIESGNKPEEYRAVTPFWTNRLENREYDTVTFQLGYSRDARKMKFAVVDIKIKNIISWETNKPIEVYAIKLGKRFLNI